MSLLCLQKKNQQSICRMLVCDLLVLRPEHV